MKKSIKILFITIVAILIVYQLLGITGLFKVYHNPTTANEPNIKINSYTIVSNLIEPQNKDFICYNFEDEFIGNHIRVHRLLGKEGDDIEIKKGNFYINSINIDKEISLMHSYFFPIKDIKKLTSIKEVINSPNSKVNREKNVIEVVLEDDFALSSDLKAQRLIERRGEVNEKVRVYYDEPWNKDNFGPLKIPKGKVFVMGDNRDYTFDSRTVGLINVSDIIGVVMNK